jgi:hypothetical protein
MSRRWPSGCRSLLLVDTEVKVRMYFDQVLLVRESMDVDPDAVGKDSIEHGLGLEVALRFAPGAWAPESLPCALNVTSVLR